MRLQKRSTQVKLRTQSIRCQRSAFGVQTSTAMSSWTGASRAHRAHHASEDLVTSNNQLQRMTAICQPSRWSRFSMISPLDLRGCGDQRQGKAASLKQAMHSLRWASICAPDLPACGGGPNRLSMTASSSRLAEIREGRCWLHTQLKVHRQRK